ncbi:hypothetical protein BWQ96_04673 [Gracilariopsis chorda]|uniref:Uncharacterized protein n=1 Tax=Gracilariopsis chorda TaxID=448386 RepID=A0A2V3ITY8_9FLOR|nr:hypothetical protein BWQ96_04673 [Gracilariopsis chorda]|eukprot:PXF45596.1 hypothetical protein BWQ96_04673 [Gracilariopsis chorda]
MQFAKLSEGLTAEMEKKGSDIKTLKTENASLRASMETVNQQLAAFLMQSAHTASRDTGTNPASEEMSAVLRSPRSMSGAKVSSLATDRGHGRVASVILSPRNAACVLIVSF